VGKTTVIRDIARTLSDDLHKRVVIVDTSNEIGGDGDVPHPAIGGARRMQVADAAKQHHVMVSVGAMRQSSQTVLSGTSCLKASAAANFIHVVDSWLMQHGTLPGV